MRYVIIEKGKRIYIPSSAKRKAYYRYDPREKQAKGRIIDKIEDIDSAKPNDWIILYHGTTVENARRIEKEGFKPDLSHNWKVESKRGYTYFSYAYAPFYAMTAKSDEKERAIVKVKVQLKDLYPEDDFIMSALGKPVYTQDEVNAVDLGLYKKHTKDSLKTLGNAAVKDTSKVKVLSVGYFDASRLIMISDPSIIPINFLIMHDYYKKLSEHLATGGTVENAPRETFPGLEQMKGEIVKSFVILEKARPYTRIRRGHLERIRGYQGRVAQFKGTEYEKIPTEERMKLASWEDIKKVMVANLVEVRTEKPGFTKIESKSLDLGTIKSIFGNMRKELSSYTKYLAGDTVDLLHKYTSLTASIIMDNIKEFGGIDSKTLNSMFIDSIRKLVHQEVESNRQQFTDHGIRHIIKNILSQNEMFDALSKQGVKISPKDKLMANFIMINHDVGYTTPLIRGGGVRAVKASKEHKEYSKKIAEEQKDSWNIGKVFSEKEYDKILDIIATHDSTELDVKDPIAMTTRIADNLSLFQKEKLPSMFEYVEGAERLLLAMGIAAKKNEVENFERYRNQLYRKIDESIISEELNRDLKSAVKEISYVTPKFTLGVLAGETRKIGSSDKSLISIEIKHNKFDETLQKLFDMGQEKTRKFLRDYGEKDYSKSTYLIGKYGDKSVLELRVV